MRSWTPCFLLVVACSGGSTPADKAPDDTAPVDTTPPDPTDDTETPEETAVFLVDTDPTDAGYWSHATVPDGQLDDWYAVERFTTSSGGESAAWITWDESYFYIAYQHPGLHNGSADQWLTLTTGTASPGAAQTPAIGGQQPTLPFASLRAIWFRADGGQNVFHTWRGYAWETVDNWLGTAGSVVAYNPTFSPTTGVVELQLHRGSFQLSGRWMHIMLTWVDATPGAEATRGAVPATAIDEGAVDPDPRAYLAFDTSLPTTPGGYAPSQPDTTAAQPAAPALLVPRADGGTVGAGAPR